MNELAKAFAKEVARREDEEFGVAVAKHVRWAMFPFDTGNITLEMEQDHRFYDWGRTLRITLEKLPNYPFTFKINERQLHQAYFPDLYLFQSIRDPIFKHFRYRPSFPVEDHILLGDE